MDLEGIVLCEISQIKRINVLGYCLYVNIICMCIQQVNTAGKKQTHRYREQTSGYQRRGVEEGAIEE